MAEVASPKDTALRILHSRIATSLIDKRTTISPATVFNLCYPARDFDPQARMFANRAVAFRRFISLQHGGLHDLLAIWDFYAAHQYSGSKYSPDADQCPHTDPPWALGTEGDEDTAEQERNEEYEDHEAYEQDEYDGSDEDEDDLMQKDKWEVKQRDQLEGAHQHWRWNGRPQGTQQRMVFSSVRHQIRIERFRIHRRGPQ